MLYDAQGRPYIEPPLLPESLIVHNIVKDYQRMFYEYHKMKSQFEPLKKQNSELKLEVYTLRRTAQQHVMILHHAIRYMKKHGLKLTNELSKYVRIYFPSL